MKSRIDSFSFGFLTVDGVKYTSDLIIYPDGHIEGSWRRRKGHRLSSADITRLIESGPAVIIAGTGVNGLVKPERELENLLQEKGIKLIPAPNGKAIELYNELSPKMKVGACFHLTC